MKHFTCRNANSVAEHFKLAGFSHPAEDGSHLQDMTDSNAEDAIDLLLLHIPQHNSSGGEGNCLPDQYQNQDSSKLWQHNKHRSTLLADAGAAVDKMGQVDADSCAALYQWLDDLSSMLLQHPAFSLSVLTVLLLNNLETDKMLQVQVLAAS